MPLSRLDDEYDSVRLEAVETFDKLEPSELLKYEAAVTRMLHALNIYVCRASAETLLTRMH